MNNGKICVPVCAKTAEEMIKQIDRAAEFADVIELRFDRLEDVELDKAIELVVELNCEKPFLVTFRPKEQGGCREMELLKDRLGFWMHDSSPLRGVDFVDIEYDLFGDYGHNWKLFNIDAKNYIVSYHNFVGTPKNLGYIYEDLADSSLWFDWRKRKKRDHEENRKAEVIKIATTTHEITHGILLFNLIAKAKKEGREIIPIAMGEAGKWTRILGLAHGAYMTYAALDDESGTAPGQITAKDMHDIYRVKDLDLDTEVYGIIGGDTSVSQSPYIHNAAFKEAGLNAVYIPLQVANLEEFMRRMVLPATREVELNFCGLSVTIPHKQAIMGYLDEIDETAKAIGAVNTVKIENGKLFGYNTDAEGFINPLLDVFGDLKGAKVALLGAGGAARACVYALKNSGADVTIFARDIEKAKTLADEFGVAYDQLSVTDNQLLNFDILVNSTPVGMRGKSEGESPVDTESLRGLKLVYDLIYIPEKTKLLADAESFGISTLGGMEMLLGQAAVQQKIWTDS